MFKLRKITVRMIALSVMLSCLGFLVAASFTEKASAQILFCRSCTNVAPHQELYCSWYVVSDCATDPPLKSTLHCELVTYCDVSGPY